MDDQVPLWLILSSEAPHKLNFLWLILIFHLKFSIS